MPKVAQLASGGAKIQIQTKLTLSELYYPLRPREHNGHLCDSVGHTTGS